jgi:hypothetical protein
VAQLVRLVVDALWLTELSLLRLLPALDVLMTLV